jgi:hypothetical protein
VRARPRPSYLKHALREREQHYKGEQGQWENEEAMRPVWNIHNSGAAEDACGSFMDSDSIACIQFCHVSSDGLSKRGCIFSLFVCVHARDWKLLNGFLWNLVTALLNIDFGLAEQHEWSIEFSPTCPATFVPIKMFISFKTGLSVTLFLIFCVGYFKFSLTIQLGS